MMDDIFNHLRNKLEAKSERVGVWGVVSYGKGGGVGLEAMGISLLEYHGQRRVARLRECIG